MSSESVRFADVPADLPLFVRVLVPQITVFATPRFSSLANPAQEEEFTQGAGQTSENSPYFCYRTPIYYVTAHL